MCGIAGWLDFNHPTPAPEILRGMADALRYRGPDGEGYFESGPIHFGHRRLSIIDVAGSPQPMSNSEESIWLIFNGEIFNFSELRGELAQRGCVFRTQGDTETIIHAYAVYGDEFLQKLEGQFALALWDVKLQKLILARDRLGQMPLYYHVDRRGGLYFASELGSLVAHPAVPRDVDPRAIDIYFAYRYIPDPQTIYRDIQRLPAAHRLDISREKLEVRRYWQAPTETTIKITEQEALEHLDELLSQAVAGRMISDVPLGAFLSGGIDSSLVVAYMVKHSTTPIKTFTIGFDQDTHDERDYARQVVERFQTDHHEFVVTPDAADVVPRMARAFGEPFADSSALPVFYLAEITRRHVTVALNGDGGDESFAGYRRYFNTARFYAYSRWPKSIRSVARALAGVARTLPIPGGGALGRLAKWKSLEGKTLGEIYQAAVTTPFDQRVKLLHPELAETLRPRADAMAEAVAASKHRDSLNRLMHGDQTVYLPGDLLVKVDRMAMHHSLEARSPFLDYRIVEFAASLPARIKAPRGESKALLKKLLGRFFPASFIQRRKMGFGVPLATWFRTSVPLQEQLRAAAESRWLNASEIARLLEEHQSGRTDHSHVLWSVLMFDAWERSVRKS